MLCSRAETHAWSRLRISGGNGRASTEDLKLVLALKSLCCHDFSSIRKAAQSLVHRFVSRFPRSWRTIVPPYFECFGKSGASKSEVSGVVYTLIHAPLLRKIGSDWDVLTSFLMELAQSHVHDNPKLQVRLNELLSGYIEVHDPICVNDEEASTARQRLASCGFMSLSSDTLHWRYRLLGLSMIALVSLPSSKKDADDVLLGKVIA